jgi:hypothetical protein
MRKHGRSNGSFLFALFVFTLLITVPYLVAYLAQGDEKIFGGFLLNPIDGNSYLAKMYQGWQGDFTFQLPYSAEKTEGVFLFVFYLLLGHIARLLQLPLLIIFHLARILGAFGLVWVLKRYIDLYFPDNRMGNQAFTLILFGLGAGWLVLPFGWITSDVWVAEGYPFLASYVNPHFPIGLAIVTALIFHDPSDVTPKTLILTSIMALALALILPFGIVIIGCVLAIEIGLLILRDRERMFVRHPLIRLLLIGIVSIPVLLYDIWLVYTDPILAGWNAQNLTPSPPLWDFLIAFSPSLILAIAAFVAVKKTPQRLIQVAAIWLLSGFLLMYLPIGLQRRMISGLFIPVGILAMFFLATRFNHPINKRNANILIGASLPTIAVILLLAGAGILQKAPELYLWRSEKESFTWIEGQTPMDALILAAPDTGLLIPAYTGRRVLYGHPFETVDAEANRDLVEAIFMDLSQGRVESIPDSVDYLFWGPRESALVSGGLPVLPLPMVYQNESVVIYFTGFSE